MDRFLASFEPAGLERRGDEWISPGYEKADRHLDISLRTTVGAVKVNWID